MTAKKAQYEVFDEDGTILEARTLDVWQIHDEEDKSQEGIYVAISEPDDTPGCGVIVTEEALNALGYFQS